MICSAKNKLLTFIFSIVLVLSIFSFVLTTVVGSRINGSKHDISKISCEIIKKETNSTNQTLTYKIHNGTTTDIKSLTISTTVFADGVTVGSFSVAYNSIIKKQNNTNFIVEVSKDLSVYDTLQKIRLRDLNVNHYLIYVSFSDSFTKTDIHELIGSSSNGNKSTNNNSNKSNDSPQSVIHHYSDDWSLNETYHWHNCIDSGYESLVIDKNEHLFNEVIVQPTYDNPGYTTHTCSECGYSYIDSQTSQLIHNYSSIWAYNELSHWHVCSDLGYSHLKSDETAHSFNNVITQPTFENEGYTTHTCSVCGYSYIDSYTSALPHNYSNVWSFDKQYHWYACIDDGYENLESGKTSHIFNSNDYLIPGGGEYCIHKCEICGYRYTDNIIFGEYPQSRVTDSSLLSALSVLSTTNSKGYYELNGEQYTRVQATPGSQENKFDDGTNIISNSIHYFKVEPIRWTCLKTREHSLFLTSEYLLDAHCFSNKGLNNYKESDIRAWLNNDFLNQAFANSLIIMNTTVDNSANSTRDSSNPYACESTNDKIFLLSREELSNKDYGFSDDVSRYDLTRSCSSTEYARARGIYYDYKEFYINFEGQYLTRSPYYNESSFVWMACENGYFYTCSANNQKIGVRPSFNLSI